MSKPLVSLEHISKSYQDGSQRRKILDDISLTVKKGEFIAIVGPSGSGKSTLLSITGALLSADSGRETIGQEVVGSSQKQWTMLRRNRIGFIFQNHQLLPFLTVKEQLLLSQSLSKKGSEKLVEELLTTLGLIDKKDCYPEQLSGGERQRVAIARSFMNDPDLILADEPTASLDKERGIQVVEMMAKEIRHRQKAGIMVTHDERVLHLVDNIYYLEDGKLRLTKLS